VADSSVFKHSVASGDPLDDRVVIWTRVTVSDTAPQEVTWRLARDRDLSDVITSGSATAEKDSDYTVKIDVEGLEPASTYYYGFEAEGESSPVARTKTLPGPEVARARFAIVACAKYNAGYFNAYSRIAARDDLAFLLHLGDYIYEMADKPPPSQTPGADIDRHTDPLHECKTLEDYRRRYSQYRQDPDIQRLHLALPIIPIVDDHEFADGVWREGAAEHKPERDGPWHDRRVSAFRARSEWQPIRLPDPADPERAWRTVSLGSLADLFLLDTRSNRDEPVAGETMHDPSRGQLGAKQKKWLLDGLADSKASWKIIGNSSIMASTWHDHLPEEIKPPLTKLKLIDPTGGPDVDQWDGYPVEREQILQQIKESRPSTVVLSGDIHISMVNDLTLRSGEMVAPEFVMTSLTSQNLDDKMRWEPRTKSVSLEEKTIEALPYVRWCDFDSHGYGVVDIERDRVGVEYWFVDTVLRPSDKESSGSAWMVERDRVEPKRVS
jgi:alkaline phosphatase D